MIKNGWSRNLHQRASTLIIHNEKILVTERKSHLVCIEPLTGDLIWDHSIDSAWGWLTAVDDKVFYLEQNAELKIMDFYSGKTMDTYELSNQPYFPFWGYVLPYKNYLITGSWRGYTDLICLNLDSGFQTIWRRKTRSKDLKSYSIPAVLNNELIFVDNTNNTISFLEIDTGNENWTTNLPNNVGSSGLDYTFQIDNGKIVVYSRDGGIFILQKEEQYWLKVVTHSKGIKTVNPKILNSQYLFQDSENNICSYDKFSGKLNWQIYSNQFQPIIPAIELNSELTIICLSQKKKMIVNNLGEIIYAFNSEKRYSSDLNVINGDIYYVTKSELKQLKIIK